MRLIIVNTCGVPVRCIMTRLENPLRFHLFFMGTNGLRTDTKGRFIPTLGEEIFDAVITAHGPRRRAIVADVPPGKKITVHDFFDSRWESKRDRYNDIVVTLTGLRN